MIEDATCRTETHERYTKIERVASVDAARFVCRHNVVVAAPSPAQAPETSWVVVSFCGRDRKSARASRWVKKTSKAVYS